MRQTELHLTDEDRELIESHRAQNGWFDDVIGIVRAERIVPPEGGQQPAAQAISPASWP